jgi:hypothetical protein
VTDKHLPLYIFPSEGRCLSVIKERYIGEMFVCPKGKIYRGRCLSVPKERYIAEKSNAIYLNRQA